MLFKIFKSKANIVKSFSVALEKRDMNTIKKYCHKNCKFYGFTDNINNRSGLIRLLRFDDKTKNQKKIFRFEKKDGYILKRVRVHYNVASILKMQGHLKVVIKYEVKWQKIISIRVEKYAPHLIDNDQKIWKEYTTWVKCKYGYNVSDLMNNIALAQEYKSSFLKGNTRENYYDLN